MISDSAPRWLGALAAAAALLTAPGAASAYCRSTTCTGDCERDPDTECKVTGHPLYWPGMCVGFSLQRDGTVNIPMDQVRPVIEASFIAWSDLDCGGSTATIAFSELDDVGCHRTEYNEEGPNANIVLFQDTKWSYKGVDNTLAKTTVTFDNDTGEIFDADIEINHAYNFFTVGDVDVHYDLESVVTHEVGHLIGLDHTLEIDATMFASYDEGSTELRTLAPDDIDAACGVYPPGRAAVCDPTPRRGLADACGPDAPAAGAGDEGGCSVAGARGAAGAGACLLFLGVAAVARRRKREARPVALIPRS